jgi:TetR/AcrR family transcriptional regulator, repressor for uid operon
LPRTVNPDRAAERRRQILEAAHTCFVRKGFHQTSIDEICTTAEISPGGLYRYFSSKDAIIEAIGEAARLEVRELLSGVRAGSNIVDGLTKLVAQFSELLTDRAEAGLGVELIAEGLRNPVIGNIMRAAESAMIDDFSELVAEGQGRGDIESSIDPRQAATVLLSAADGLGLRLALGHKITPQEASNTLQSLLNRYLRPTGAA